MLRGRSWEWGVCPAGAQERLGALSAPEAAFPAVREGGQRVGDHFLFESRGTVI